MCKSHGRPRKLLRKLSEKATEEDIMQAYPQLASGDIQAAIRFAADTIAHEETVFISVDPDVFQL